MHARTSSRWQRAQPHHQAGRARMLYSDARARERAASRPPHDSWAEAVHAHRCRPHCSGHSRVTPYWPPPAHLHNVNAGPTEGPAKATVCEKSSARTTVCPSVRGGKPSVCAGNFSRIVVFAWSHGRDLAIRGLPPINVTTFVDPLERVYPQTIPATGFRFA